MADKVALLVEVAALRRQREQWLRDESALDTYRALDGVFEQAIRDALVCVPPDATASMLTDAQLALVLRVLEIAEWA